MTTVNKQTSTIQAQKPFAVLSFEGQNTGAWKRFVCKLLRFFLRRRFCRQNWYYVAQLYTPSISRYFFVTMPQEARRENSGGETSMRASRRTLQASVLSVHFLQTNCCGDFVFLFVSFFVPFVNVFCHILHAFFTRFFEDENKQEISLGFRPDMKKN